MSPWTIAGLRSTDRSPTACTYAVQGFHIWAMAEACGEMDSECLWGDLQWGSRRWSSALSVSLCHSLQPSTSMTPVWPGSLQAAEWDGWFSHAGSMLARIIRHVCLSGHGTENIM